MNTAAAFTRQRVQFVFLACTLIIAGQAWAQLDNVRMTAAATWFNAHQSAAGSWGTVDELVPRDTSRVLHAYFLTKAATTSNFDGAGTTLAQNRGLAWLGSLPLDANQLLAEQAMALTAGGRDASAVFGRLLQQRSVLGADFGGFADPSGDTYDSALALEAFATNETVYAGSISGIITTLGIRMPTAAGEWTAASRATLCSPPRCSRASDPFTNRSRRPRSWQRDRRTCCTVFARTAASTGTSSSRRWRSALWP